MTAREMIYRSCNLCEAHCGVAIEVDRTTNTILDIRGDENDAMSAGYVCPKAVGLEALSSDPDRLRHPVKRVGDAFVEISWDEAYDLVSERLLAIRNEHGANAIATYLGNPNAHDYASNFSVPALVRALGTKWRFSATSVDQLPKMVSSCLLYGSPGAFPVPDIDRTDFFLVLGANPLASNGSLMTAPDMRGRLRKLRERGGKLVVVDPRRSETARIADTHLPLRPGADAYFLFAMLHVIFAEGLDDLGHLAEHTEGLEAVRDLAREFSPESVETRTGISPQAIRDLARAFAAADKAACYGRIGTCTQEFGSLASWLVDVVNAVTGNLDREGGIMFPLPAHETADQPGAGKGRVPYARWRSRVRNLPEWAGELPVAALAEEIDTPGDGRVRALLTVAGNPALSTPNADRLDRALEELEFMVSVDIYINETTRHADVILPTSAPLERTNYDLAFHKLSVRNHAKWSPAVLPRPEGVRDLFEICTELAARLGGGSAQQVQELILGGMIGRAVPAEEVEAAKEKLGGTEGPARILDAALRSGAYGDGFRGDGSGMTLASLQAAEHGVDLGPMQPRLPDMLSTASGKVELVHELLVEDVERLREKLHAPTEDLVLIGRRHVRNNNSWMHNVRALSKGPERCTLLVHPDDAAKCGVAHQGRARVKSRAGEVEVPVEVSDEMRPGVVSLPHGFGHGAPRTRTSVAAALQPGVNSNILTDEYGLDALSCNAILNGIPVEVTPAN